MKLCSSSVVIVVCCIIVQFQNYRHLRYLLFETEVTARIGLITIQGIGYLSYPLLGHLADAYLTRYRVTKLGLTILNGGILYITVCVIIYTIVKNVGGYQIPSVVAVLGICLIIVGIGLFESNAIQFGLDQLLEAPTPKPIAFIHWYYWAQSVGQLITFYTFTSVAVAVYELGKEDEFYYTETAYMALLAIIYLVTLVLYCVSKKLFYIEKAGLNPFKNIYKVLKYSWKHKVPERRSAFTYWEEDIPRRIGKPC